MAATPVTVIHHFRERKQTMFSMPSLILILVIVILLFGTKRLKGLGSDLGGALKGFKKAVNESDNESQNAIEKKEKGSIIEGEIVKDESEQNAPLKKEAPLDSSTKDKTK